MIRFNDKRTLLYDKIYLLLIIHNSTPPAYLGCVGDEVKDFLE